MTSEKAPPFQQLTDEMLSLLFPHMTPEQRTLFAEGSALIEQQLMIWWKRDPQQVYAQWTELMGQWTEIEQGLIKLAGMVIEIEEAALAHQNRLLQK